LLAKEANRHVRAVREQIIVTTPSIAAQHLMTSVFAPFAEFDQEELCVLLLNTRNRITHDVFLYRGTLNAVHVRPAEVFKEAIRMNAASIILAHNHPSGDPNPSPQDVSLTEEFVALGKTLDIALLDHIIIGEQNWLSMREKNLGFP
jgi:DNA repair protein RadC